MRERLCSQASMSSLILNEFNIGCYFVVIQNHLTPMLGDAFILSLLPPFLASLNIASHVRLQARFVAPQETAQLKREN